MKEKKLHKEKLKIEWGKELSQLPTITMEEVQNRVKKGEALIIVDNIVHEVKDFMEEHPGGKSFISTRLGKDVTSLFRGEIYDHSNAANNVLSMLRVAVLSKKLD